MKRANVGFQVPVVLAAVLVTASASWAQTRQIQGGNALDANPMVGAGGINFAAPRPQINRANAIMTGNVGSGMGFQGYSPIRDSSQFFINLPTSALSNFNAQSMDVGALQSGITNYQPHYYYAPSKTITNLGGIERGLNGSDGSVPASPFVYPRERLQPVIRDPITLAPFGGRQPTGRGLAVEPGLQRVFSGGVSVGEPMRFNERLLASPLFGRAYDVPLSQLRDWSEATGGVPGVRNPALAQTPFQVEPSAGPGAIESPLDRVLGKGPVQVTREVNYGVDARVRAAQTTGGIGQEASIASAQQPLSAAAAALQPGAEPEWLGRDRFQDMAAVARSVREQGLDLSPTAGTAVAGAPVPGPAWVQEYLSRPVTSFVGSSPTALNEYLRRAETEMRAGKYYRAASIYAMAASVDPSSPLPIVGRSQALIAAGEYLTAVSLLSKAIEDFPGIAYFRIDLKAFITDPRVLESRRADLERLLKENDDYRLRFLLGYLEYYSGYTLPGLDDMAKAAAKAPPGSPVARFLDLLKQGKSVPPVPTTPQSKLLMPK